MNTKMESVATVTYDTEGQPQEHSGTQSNESLANYAESRGCDQHLKLSCLLN